MNNNFNFIEKHAPTYLGSYVRVDIIIDWLASQDTYTYKAHIKKYMFDIDKAY
jgi:hypothetical protein